MMGLSASVPKDGKPRLQLVGPLGLRAFLRATLSITYASLSSHFIVHELLWPSQPAYPHNPEGISTFSYTEQDSYLPEGVRGQVRTLPLLPPHENELPGRDIRMNESTCTWPSILQLSNVTISAAPITHRCPTVGYVFQEGPTASRSVSQEELAIIDSNKASLFELYNIRSPRSLLSRVMGDRETITLPDGHVLSPPPLDRPGRKLCILGDTSDATAGLVGRGMAYLARDADLLVHECTYASMNAEDMEMARIESEEHAQMLRKSLLGVQEAETRALSRGHSVPRIVGSFSGEIRARRVVLNHFSARLPAPVVSTEAPLTSTHQLKQGTPFKNSVKQFYVMREIERQVTKYWHASLPEEFREFVKNDNAVAAFDGLAIDIAPHSAPTEQNTA